MMKNQGAFDKCHRYMDIFWPCRLHFLLQLKKNKCSFGTTGLHKSIRLFERKERYNSNITIDAHCHLHVQEAAESQFCVFGFGNRPRKGLARKAKVYGFHHRQLASEQSRGSGSVQDWSDRGRTSPTRSIWPQTSQLKSRETSPTTRWCPCGSAAWPWPARRPWSPGMSYWSVKFLLFSELFMISKDRIT